MADQSTSEHEPFHFGPWVEMTVLMDFLSSDERALLLDALRVSASEYAAVSALYREALQAKSDPEKTAIFQAARQDAARRWPRPRHRPLQRFSSSAQGARNALNAASLDAGLGPTTTRCLPTRKRPQDSAAKAGRWCFAPRSSSTKSRIFCTRRAVPSPSSAASSALGLGKA